MSYYQHHMFFCLNKRDEGSSCCCNYDAEAMFKYAKVRSKSQGLHDDGKVRISRAGCMGRCGEGPVLVIYPEAVWYTYANTPDIDEIIKSHLLKGKIVKRLKI